MPQAPPPPKIREDPARAKEQREEKQKKRKELRKKKKKKKKRPRAVQQNGTSQKADTESADDVEIEYVADAPEMDPSDPLYRQFAHIFETFKISEPPSSEQGGGDGHNASADDQAPQQPQDLKKVPKLLDGDDDSDDEGDDTDQPKISKRKMKKLTRMTIAQLKQQVARPDVVEMHDVTSRDPLLLVALKSTRNTVPVPRHWCFKRKYLQGKRGIEKPPFDLPEFIKKTGIMEMRQALAEKEEAKNMKAKMREKVRPKMGKIDIDYQKLHDAFFKWQTKPRMTIHGDLYYEGKEFETRLKEKKPGDLSDDLRTALGMPVGASSNKIPPPWLIAMQRYGPPPSYPNLKIPGLNAPIPEGCSFGYHAGGWGKPPVDEHGKPLYGDVFGVQSKDFDNAAGDEDVERTLWGELESESEESESEEESEEEEGEGVEESGLVTPAEGLITPSGVTSIPAGMETPEMIELRKRKVETEMEGGETPSLYQVLPERRNERVGAAMMASTHTYDLPGKRPAGAGGEGVEVALDPSELDLVDTDAMAQRYEERMRETQLEKEDLSDMVAEHAAKQKNKRKRQQAQQDDKKSKKYKEFKF
ncbi:splicing factor 3B subunit 2-like isoform X2 [Amphibalanus amphitrite]|nr:splicing factor 3B subunit 2-like isoform X2 [Amphibalanus amphitrite]XP_043205913.1 splicing factor 3B subunit 2-like isoform X2 [Amphibalanus amphitrite]